MADRKSSRKKGVALLLVGMVLGAALITPAGAHVTTVAHSWKRHFLPLAKKVFYVKGKAVKAPAFLYNTPKTGSAFVDPTSCQRDGSSNPYGATVAHHEINNAFGPGISTDASSGTVAWYCPITIPRPPGAAVRITGARLVHYDPNTTCLVGGQVYTKPFAGSYGSATKRAEVFNGSGGADLAYTTPDAPTIKDFPAFSFTQPEVGLVWFRPFIQMSAGNSCRFIGAHIKYTVDRA